MTTEVEVRKIGNSLGVLFSKQFVEDMKIKEREKLWIDIKRKIEVKDIFGKLKERMTGQEFKELVRSGWK